MNVLATRQLLAAEGGGGITTVLPAPAELFWGAVAFLIFYLVMQRFAFPLINQVLEDRAAAIQGRISEAEERLSEADRIKAEYEEQLADAKNEANRIIEEARQTGESLRRDIVAKAETESEQIVQRARSEVQAERERAVQDLRAEVGRLSVQLAEKIVQKELDESAHAQLIDRYIGELAGTNGSKS
ncbi:MAG: F0F1 ATP synthase subunit B [Nitriliruptorales bacterium]